MNKIFCKKSNISFCIKLIFHIQYFHSKENLVIDQIIGISFISFSSMSMYLKSGGIALIIAKINISGAKNRNVI